MPATLAPPATSKRVEQRARALDLFLRQLRDPASATGAGIVAELRSDAWIQSQLTTGIADIGGDSAGIRTLVEHGCAFLAKSHADRECMTVFAERDKNSLYTLQAELMLDAAIGAALLRETQPAVEEAVRVGDPASARGLTQLGHRLRKEVAAARNSIGEAERGNADQLVDALTEKPPEAAPAGGALDQFARGIADARDPDRRRRGIRARLPSQFRLPTRTELLVLTLMCSLVLWVGVAKLPQFLDTGPRLIVGEDFVDANVLSVVARPPSLYVTIDASNWDTANAATRTSILAEVVSVPLVQDGYRGALIETSDGRPVAVWFRGTGVRLLETREPIVDPGATEKAVLFVP